jgi:HK97 family phage major capsid protein
MIKMADNRITIRLLQEWNNAGKHYPIGQLLKLSQEDSGKLIGEGIAERYEKSNSDLIVESPFGGGLSETEVQDIVKDVLSEQERVRREQENAEPRALKNGGFNGFSDFLREVYKSAQSPTERMYKWIGTVKSTGMEEAVGHDGGFLVPTEFKNTLWRNTLEKSILLNRCTKIPMQTSSVGIPVIDETTHSGSVYGGVIVYKVEEGGTKTASKPKFGKCQLNLHKYVVLMYATDELLQDTPISLEPLLNTMASEALAFQVDDDIIFGTGAGEILGITNSPCIISVTRDAGAPSIEIMDVSLMWRRLLARSHGNAIWLANHDCFDDLARLRDGTGAPYGLMRFSTTGMVGEPYATLLGRPVFFTEHAQTLGTAGDLILGDFSQFLIGQRAGGGIKSDTSIHVAFTTDETAFRFVLRIDGQPWMRSAITPVRGSNTLSSFVQLS